MYSPGALNTAVVDASRTMLGSRFVTSGMRDRANRTSPGR